MKCFPAIEAVGDRCLIVRFGTQITPDVTQAVHALSDSLLADPIPGVVDVVPAFTTVALHCRPTVSEMAAATGSAEPTLLERITATLTVRLSEGIAGTRREGRVVEVPVCYGGEYGPDLDDVAARCGMTPAEVIALHGANDIPVLTFFFSPGNPFAGPMDDRLKVPRRTTPRERVIAGSVGIANGLSSIYQVTGPGGWNILGRTPWTLFDLRNDPPTRLALGDRLRFVPISESTFIETDEHGRQH